MYENLTVDIILSGEKLKAFPLRSRYKARMSTFTTSIQYSAESSSQSKRRTQKALK
jgi:hypothetical protein